MGDKPVDIAALHQLRHDINNQLSNIHLALEGIKHEMPTPTDEFNIYTAAIYTSAVKINALLNAVD